MATNRDRDADRDEPDRAILFELENVAVKGRQIIYDVLKSVLAAKGVELGPLMFSRYCLHLPVKHFFSDLLKSAEKTRLSADKLLAEITEGIKLSLTDGSLKLDSVLEKILKAAADRNVLAGALSYLDGETSRQLMTKLGLADTGVHLHSSSCQDNDSSGADTWLKLATQVSVPSSRCLVLATSSLSCRAALSAGMRCIVIPDTFTSFQDFGGVDYVLGALSEIAVEDIFALLQCDQGAVT